MIFFKWYGLFKLLIRLIKKMFWFQILMISVGITDTLCFLYCFAFFLVAKYSNIGIDDLIDYAGEISPRLHFVNTILLTLIQWCLGGAVWSGARKLFPSLSGETFYGPFGCWGTTFVHISLCLFSSAIFVLLEINLMRAYLMMNKIELWDSFLARN